jgi:pimeloyl-ACP methyl ester carboxylesterase
VTYRAVAFPVDGTELSGAVWGPDDGPAVLAVHGITASHLSWPVVARALPQARFIAADLRGRAGSADAPPPWDMTAHADDMAGVLDTLGVERAVVVGHSMGGFVAGWMAARHPDRVSALVLVDGGLPLPWPAGVPKDESAPGLMLGPAGDRLRRVYPDRDAYLAFWRAHPAFATTWNDDVERYALYDVEDVADGVRPRTRLDPVATNIVQLSGDGGYLQAVADSGVPIDFLHAPRGLMNEVPPLYADAVLQAALEAVPRIRVHEVPGVNHYTIVMGAAGAAEVARMVSVAVSAAADDGSRPVRASRTEEEA